MRYLVPLLAAFALPAFSQEQEMRPIERQRAADERAPLTIPVGGIIQPVENLR